MEYLRPLYVVLSKFLAIHTDWAKHLRKQPQALAWTGQNVRADRLKLLFGRAEEFTQMDPNVCADSPMRLCGWAHVST
jgi:hypothetical protein